MSSAGLVFLITPEGKSIPVYGPYAEHAVYAAPADLEDAKEQKMYSCRIQPGERCRHGYACVAYAPRPGPYV